LRSCRARLCGVVQGLEQRPEIEQRHIITRRS
jgi:hypothetical protein